MKKLASALIIGAGLVAQAHASVITPIAVDASSTFYTYNANNLINNSGLSGGLHDNQYFNMWLDNGTGTNAQLTFDLGSIYAVSAADIWQYNASCCGLDRGVNIFTISTSTDGINFYDSTTASLTEANGGDIPAQVVDYQATGRYVRFDVVSNWGDTNYTGLSEVKFETSAVPEPETYALFGAGLGIISLLARRRQTRS